MLSPVKARIKNFQSIEDLEIEIYGFTCITGKTNIGKSAIIRALSSSILNRPVTGMIRKGANHSSVDLSSDGWGFLWEKGERGVNRYTINDKVYDKVGQKQLQEIRDIGFSSISIGDEEIQPWFASQFSPLFLLDRSGPQITNFISDVSNLNVIQDAIVLSSREKRKATDFSKEKSVAIAETKQKINKFSAFSSIQEFVQEIRDQAESIQKYEDIIESLNRIQSGLLEHTRKVDALSEATNVRVPRLNIDEFVSEISWMVNQNSRLVNAAKRVLKIRGINKIELKTLSGDLLDEIELMNRFLPIKRIEDLIHRLENVDSIELPKENIKSIFDEISQLKSFKSRIDSIETIDFDFSKNCVPNSPVDKSEISEIEQLKKLVVSLKQQYHQVLSSKKELDDIEKEIESVEKELQEFKECPTCLRQL